jgi:hypothetical protein
VRSALESLLVFLDCEPLLARVWLVESLGAGAWVLEHRARKLEELRAVALERWPAAEAWGSSPLAAEGAIASVFGVIQNHIVTGRPGSLIELLGPLTGLVAAHYLPPHLVAREVELSDGLAHASRPPQPQTTSTNVEIPSVLGNPNAHRARRCVIFLSDRPQASNREIAAAVGVAHQSQISKLLSSLLNEGLLAKHSAGVGKRNSWQLTPHGEDVTRALLAGEDGPITFGASAPRR